MRKYFDPPFYSKADLDIPRKDGNSCIYRNVDTKFLSASEQDEKPNHSSKEILSAFDKFPEIKTLDKLFDAIIDAYSNYPMFGSINKNKSNSFEWITYSEFGALVKGTSFGLAKWGDISDKIGDEADYFGVLLEKSIYYPLAQWSIAYLGAVIIPIDISFEIHTIRQWIQIFRCTSLICSIYTLCSIILQLFPSDNLQNIKQIYLFCDEDDLKKFKESFFTESNPFLEDLSIEENIGRILNVSIYSLPQIVIPKIKKKHRNPEPQFVESTIFTPLPKKIKIFNEADEDEISDVEIEVESDSLSLNDEETENFLSSRIPIEPDTLCALNAGTGRCNLLKQCHLTHKNLIAAASGIKSCGYKFGRDIYMSNIPMHRVVERSMQLAILVNGGCIGFFDLEYEANDILTYLNDLKPTILVLTGDVMKQLYDELFSYLTNQSIFIRLFYDFCFSLMQQAAEALSEVPWLAKVLVVERLQKVAGGRLKLLISATSYLDKVAQHSLRTMLQIPVIQLYGVTECGGVCCIQNIHDHKVYNIGAPTTSCEIMIRNFDLAFSKVQNKGYGEILIRGPNVFKCYQKNPDLTKQYLVDNEWFATEDLGRVQRDGTVELIDTINDFKRRKKDHDEFASKCMANLK